MGNEEEEAAESPLNSPPQSPYRERLSRKTQNGSSAHGMETEEHPGHEHQEPATMRDFWLSTYRMRFAPHIRIKFLFFFFFHSIFHRWVDREQSVSFNA